MDVSAKETAFIVEHSFAVVWQRLEYRLFYGRSVGTSRWIHQCLEISSVIKRKPSRVCENRTIVRCFKSASRWPVLFWDDNQCGAISRNCRTLRCLFTAARRRLLVSAKWGTTTVHTANTTMKFLREFFGERIISRPLWPPRSPDLTPPDFYLWRYVKDQIFQKPPNSIAELKERNYTGGTEECCATRKRGSWAA